mmetsp:Transcript_31656/g.97836  ORF Transcript_31656/g.97836 Transcript_31656/m.97836 type:complete len:229 (+) Transcript_31656:1560-2246(+)
MTRLYTNRMYLAGAIVVGPTTPTRCRICVDRAVNSQSSMNSHRWKSDDSLVSGITHIRAIIASTIAFLKSKPPSSRKKLARKPTRMRCFKGYLRHSSRMAVTTTILNSSAISFMNEEICFIRRSTDDSEPVLSKVVIAKVAIERLLSVMSDSISSLHLITAAGLAIATVERARIAASRSEDLGEERKSCNTATAGPRSRSSMPGKEHSALAASYMTASERCRKDNSRN